MSSFIVHSMPDEATDLQTALLELDRQQRLIQTERQRLERYEAEIENRRREIIARSRRMHKFMVEREQENQFFGSFLTENLFRNMMADFSAWQEQRQRQDLIRHLLLGEQHYTHPSNDLSAEHLFGISPSRRQHYQVQKPYNQSSSFLLSPDGKRGSRRGHSQHSPNHQNINICGSTLERKRPLESEKVHIEKSSSLLEALQSIRSSLDEYHSEMTQPQLEPQKAHSLERNFEKAIDDIIAVDIEPESELRGLKMNILQSAEDGLEKAATLSAGVDESVPAPKQTESVSEPSVDNLSNSSTHSPQSLEEKKVHKVTLEEVPDSEYE